MIKRKEQLPIAKAKGNVSDLPESARNKKELRELAHKFFAEFNGWLESRTGVHYRKIPAETDLYRLLVFRSWMIQYKVDMPFIVDHIVKWYMKKMAYKRHGNFGIGVGFATLTGRFSKQLLEEAIARSYPNKENLTDWRSERKRLMNQEAIPRMNLEFEDPSDFISHYKAEIERKQRNNSKQQESNISQRRYRDNPWQ